MQGCHEIPLEEIRTCGKRDWVGNGGLENVGIAGEEHERFGDGGGGHLREYFDERFDGRDGHGEVWVFGEKVLIGGDDVEGVSVGGIDISRGSKCGI